MPICSKCEAKCKGVHRDNENKPLCSNCVSKNDAKNRTKNICRLCEDREVFYPNKLMICCRCLAKYKRYEGKRLCSDCNAIVRHKFDWTEKCGSCFNTDNPRDFINRSQNHKRAMKKVGTP